MKYGEVLPDWFKYIPFWAKKDLQTNPFRLLPLQPGDSVFDCGAHVGMFSVAALEQGAATVRCFEPVPKNIQRLRENTYRYGNKVTIVEAALVGEAIGSVSMNLSGFDGAHQLVDIADSLNKPRSKKIVSVPSLSFVSELRKYRPTVVKIDVEGAEYEILDSLRPGDFRSVKSLFVEFHPIFERELRIERIVAFLVAEGFSILNDKKRSFVASRP